MQTQTADSLDPHNNPETPGEPTTDTDASRASLSVVEPESEDYASDNTDGSADTLSEPEPEFEPQRNKVSLLTLFKETFLLSALTFGGGYVIVALMRDSFVKKHKWLSEREMLDLIAVAQSAPGPVAVTVSALAGYRLAGLRGAATAIFATVLPPMLVLSIISLAYTQFKENRVLQLILRGMRAGVAAVVLAAVAGLTGKNIKKNDYFAISIALLAFASLVVFDINVMFVILAALFIGIARMLLRSKFGRNSRTDNGGEES